MPFKFLQKNLLGKRKLEEVLNEAQALFEAYTWGASNLESGQYGGDYIKLTDTKATTVAGGASVAGTQTRALNTEDSDTGNNCTLSSNQFTLLAGTYQIKALAPGYKVDRHRIYLYNITDTNVVSSCIGTSEGSSSSDNTITKSFIGGEFNITVSKVFEIRHYTQTAQAVNGLGIETSDALSEIYTVVELWKVK